MKEHIYSEEWKKKDADRKDLTYSPLSKNLMQVVHAPIETPQQRQLLSKVLLAYEEQND